MQQKVTLNLLRKKTPDGNKCQLCRAAPQQKKAHSQLALPLTLQCSNFAQLPRSLPAVLQNYMLGTAGGDTLQDRSSSLAYYWVSKFSTLADTFSKKCSVLKIPGWYTVLISRVSLSVYGSTLFRKYTILFSWSHREAKSGPSLGPINQEEVVPFTARQDILTQYTEVWRIFFAYCLSCPKKYIVNGIKLYF